jgi:hypothetical protein
VVVDLDGAGVADIGLFPSLDGVRLVGDTILDRWTALQTAAPDGAGVGEMFTLSYTISVALEKPGPLDVFQQLGSTTGPTSFSWERANLSVVYVPR